MFQNTSDKEKLVANNTKEQEELKEVKRRLVAAEKDLEKKEDELRAAKRAKIEAEEKIEAKENELRKETRAKVDAKKTLEAKEEELKIQKEEMEQVRNYAFLMLSD